MAVFEDLNVLNINGHTEKKQVEGKELTYLSWPWAWAEVKKRYPDAHYTICKNESGLPYTEDPQTGYMVYTSVTIDGITHEMWLPVMDGANKAMRAQPYKYTTKWGEKTVEAASMMDINKPLCAAWSKTWQCSGLAFISMPARIFRRWKRPNRKRCRISRSTRKPDRRRAPLSSPRRCLPTPNRQKVKSPGCSCSGELPR